MEYIISYQLTKNIMKLAGFFIFSIILLQTFSEAKSAANSTAESFPIKKEKTAGHENLYYQRKINCNYACKMRCVKSSRKNMCNRACQTCCFQCKCVPPGTHGNHHLCPCYANLKTHGNRRKCP